MHLRSQLAGHQHQHWHQSPHPHLHPHHPHWLNRGWVLLKTTTPCPELVTASEHRSAQTHAPTCGNASDKRTLELARNNGPQLTVPRTVHGCDSGPIRPLDLSHRYTELLCDSGQELFPCHALRCDDRQRWRATHSTAGDIHRQRPLGWTTSRHAHAPSPLLHHGSCSWIHRLPPRQRMRGAIAMNVFVTSFFWGQSKACCGFV